MMRRNHAAGIRQEHPALAVRAAHRRCGDRTAVDVHAVADVDTLPRKRCDSLDQRREAPTHSPRRRYPRRRASAKTAVMGGHKNTRSPMATGR